MSHCSPHNIIRPAKGQKLLRFADGDTSDIIKVILAQDQAAHNWIDPNGVQCLLGDTEKETLGNIYKFVKGNIRYKADKPGEEKVKTPGALFEDRVGDCKSLTIAVVSIARALGFNDIIYRFAAYDNGPYTHVYPVIRSGGNDYILDTVYNRPFAQQSFHHKLDRKAARVNGVQGVHGLNQNAQINGTVQTVYTLAFVAVGIYLLTKI